jgi:hypothetical protein
MGIKEEKNTSGRLYSLAILILLLILTNLVYASYFIRDAYPSHNMISNLIMAAAPLNGLGLPYKDYWDIYPPGIFIFLSPFEYLFNGQTIVFKVFHILFSVLMGLMVLKFLYHIFRGRFTPLILFFLLYLLFSNYYYCILFHNAFLALVLSVSGVYLLAFAKKNWIKYFVSSILLAFSASMKETFLFTAFLPFLYLTSRYLIRERKSLKLFAKHSTAVIAGIGIVFLGNYLFLHLLGVKNSYSEVAAYKSQLVGGGSFLQLFNNLNPFNFGDFSSRFKIFSSSFFLHSPHGFIYYLYLFLFLVFLIPVRSIKQNGKRNYSLGKWNNIRGLGIILPGFFVLHYEGFQLLNKVQANYALQMVPALVLASAFLYKISKNKLQDVLAGRFGNNIHYPKIKNGAYAFVLFCFIWVFYPKFSHFSFLQTMSLSEYVNGFSVKKPEVIIPEKVKRIMGNDARIFHIYGWGTPYFYYFSKTKPFSRFFIIHPSILGEVQLKEFVEQFKNELPKVVIYNKTGADMDVSEFENNTIQFEKLLSKCYELHPAIIYSGYNCNGYYLLKSDSYFKSHPEDFIALKYR